jgi:transposase
MRGNDPKRDGMFSYVSPEQRVPAEHRLRPLRTMMDDILKEMSPRFAKLYANTGRPSIPPERLLRALLLQILYRVRSERLLMEQLNYNLLFRWFVGMGLDEVVWNHAVFSKNRERLLNEEVAEVFFQRVLERTKPYLSDEHSTVDGTLIEAWASHKSFRRKEGGEPPSANGREVDFHGEKRSNETHQSTTDPDARLYNQLRKCYEEAQTVSLQPVIPWRVALQHSSPPLHQPRVILKEKRKFEKKKPLDCKCANSKLMSQQKRSPHISTLPAEFRTATETVAWCTSRPIYLVSFMRTLLSVGVDANDQNLL